MRRHGGNVFLLYRPECRLFERAEAFLGEIGLRPLLLQSSAGQQLTIVERFEDYASEAYAIVLLSRSGSAGGPADRNLLFQLGFLAGKLGRRRVAALIEDDLALPAECSDILCIPIDDIGIWKFALMRDLVVAGFAVRRELAVLRPERPPQRRPDQRLADRG